MGAARVSTSVVDFAALASKIPSSQAGSFNALRGKVEKHLRNVNALPAALPNIDFAAYNKVSVPGMVETFETKYKALQVPYPSDQRSLQGQFYQRCFYFYMKQKIFQLSRTKPRNRRLPTSS